MATERLAPTAFVGTPTNLLGPVTNVDEDPDSPDSLWLTAGDTTANTQVALAFPTASGDLTGTQEIRARVRKAGGATNPTARLEVWRSGVQLAAGPDTTVSLSTVLSLSWTGTLPDGIEVQVVGTAPGGNPSKRSTVEVGAVEWNAQYQVPSPDRAAEVSWAEVEAPIASRAIELSWAEVEAPLAARAVEVAWVEVEVPILALAAEIAWTEIEVPDAPRAAEVAWSELEVPTFVQGASAEVSWTELELPQAPRAAEVGWTEIEVPTAPRSAQVSWVQMEAPLAPRAAEVAWVELQVPDVGGQQPTAQRFFMSLLGVGQ